jgi:hypothetical protein
VERFLFKWRFARGGRRSFGRTNPSQIATRIDASNARHFVGVAQRRAARRCSFGHRDGWCP